LSHGITDVADVADVEMSATSATVAGTHFNTLVQILAWSSAGKSANLAKHASHDIAGARAIAIALLVTQTP
jgi:hypothetical protein